MIFTVSGFRVKTFTDFTRESTGRWSEHMPINSAPISEFLGPGLDEIELSMVFTRMLGVEPTVSYELIRRRIRRGDYFPLFLGGLPVSLNLWYMTEIIGTSSIFTPGTARTMYMECTATLKEYH